MIYLVSAYKGKDNNLLFIPHAKDEKGNHVEINRPITLNPPYEVLDIGNAVKKGFEISLNEPVQHSSNYEKVYEIVSGASSYSKFSKDRLSCCVVWDTEKEYRILPLIRFPDGSYRPVKAKVPPVILSLDVSEEQLGCHIMDVFMLLSATD